jgi:hypothetical protein
MNASVVSEDDVSVASSQKFSTLNASRNQFVPEVKKKQFLNPYFFVSLVFTNFVAETTKDEWKQID